MRTSPTPAAAASSPFSTPSARAAVEAFDRTLSAQVASGRPLTASQRAELQKQAGNLVMAMPLDSFSSGAVARLERALGRRLAPGELKGKSLKDLGAVGGRIAKELVLEFKAESPAAFYGLAAVAAAAAGYAAYSGGSAAIEKLGIRPEFKTGLFKDSVTVGARAKWQPKFKDPSLDLSVDGKLGRYGSAGVDVGVDGRGVSNVGLRYDYKADKVTVGASVGQDLRDGATRLGVEARYEPHKNVTFNLGGSASSNGDKQVQVGVKVRF